MRVFVTRDRELSFASAAYVFRCVCKCVCMFIFVRNGALHMYECTLRMFVCVTARTHVCALHHHLFTLPPTHTRTPHKVAQLRRAQQELAHSARELAADKQRASTQLAEREGAQVIPLQAAVALLPPSVASERNLMTESYSDLATPPEPL
jgi:hypothetical protein